MGSAGGAGWAARQVLGVAADARLPVMPADAQFPPTEIKMDAGASSAAVLDARRVCPGMEPA